VVKNNNISEFQSLFANNVIEKFKERNEDFDVSLQKVLDKYREKFFKRYKEFQDSNFYFNYQGTETEGDLYIFFNEQRSAKKPIILENEEWVFNKL
jgi:coproporphyrinogen III oxidase